MNTEQAERVGELYGEALENFDDFGAFQRALSNAMTYRSHNWDIDEFERVLSWFIDAEVGHNPAWDYERYRELQMEHRSDESSVDYSDNQT